MIRNLGRLHLVATVTWIALILPTLLWWKESILWIALMSIWANVASHAAAWQAHKEAVTNGDTGSSG